VKNPSHPITDQCQYQLHVQLQTSVNTTACPITDQCQY